MPVRLGWVIAGGESGTHARPVQPAWIAEIRDTCAAAGVPFFFKQWGGRTPKADGRDLEGRTWDGAVALSDGGQTRPLSALHQTASASSAKAADS
jgi:protein gp37